MNNYNSSLSKVTTLLVKWVGVALIAASLAACQLPFFSKPESAPATKPKQEVKVAENTSGFGGTGKVEVAQSKQTENTTQLAEGSGFGGTGIIGTITEFGSIWVNGIEVEYPENVTVKSNLLADDNLQIGQQVIVETVIDKVIPWTANIEIYYPLAGKIERVKSDHIVIDGKTVFISKETKVAEGLKIEVGQYVAVNGYPNLDQSWNATLLSHNPTKKHLFQNVPKVGFSKQVRQLNIQTTKSQLADWDQQFSGLPINLIQTGSQPNNQHYLLTAEIRNGEIMSYHLQQYNLAVGDNKHTIEKEKTSLPDK